MKIMTRKPNVIKCIIFDVGGVLVRENILSVFEDANKTLGKKAFKERKGLYRVARTGKISMQEHYKILGKKTGISPQQLRRAFLQSFLKTMKPNKDTINIAKRLKQKGYKISIISNISEMSKKANIKRNLYDGFSPVIHSCDVGCIKPQKKIFDIFLKRANVKPHECVFIDVIKEHFHYPKKMGIKVIHFKSTNRLIKDLQKLGVKI